MSASTKSNVPWPLQIVCLESANAKMTVVEILENAQSVPPKLLIGRGIAILDGNLLQNSFGKAFLEKAKENGIQILEVESGEKTKSIQYVELHCKNFEFNEFDFGIVIGGGTVINLAYYVFSQRRKLGKPFSVVCIPSNTMSICDVAIGSLGMLNDIKANRKNAVRLICDPDAILLSEELLETGDDETQHEGIVEVIKHAIFQDCSRIEHFCHVFFDESVSRRDLFYASLEGLKLKADIMELEIKKGNLVAGLIKSYAHLHASAIEEATEFKIRHSSAVVAGMLVDLKIAGIADIFDLLLRHCRDWKENTELLDVFKSYFFNSVVEKYPAAGKFVRGDKYSILNPKRLLNGEILVDQISNADIIDIQKEEIIGAFNEVSRLLFL